MKAMAFEQVGKNEWHFKESKRLYNAFEILSGAEELKDNGYLEEAAEEFRKLIKKVPECIEAYNNLYLCHLYLGHNFEAFAVLEATVDLFISLIPQKFIDEEHCLTWGFLENRPFMRLYANLGLEYEKRGKFLEAKTIFDRLLKWNPNDNQGMREVAFHCNIELKLFEEALNICDRYSGDALPSILFGRPLVLIMLGKNKEAEKALRLAIKYYSKIAIELLNKNHKPPVNFDENYIAMGSDGEAYLYWKDFGQYWEQTPGALTLLSNVVKRGVTKC